MGEADERGTGRAAAGTWTGLRKRLWDPVRQSWSEGEAAYEWSLRVLWVLPLLSAVLLGLGWGLALGCVAAVLYFAIGTDSRRGEICWYIGQWGLLLILLQDYYLMWMIKELVHASVGRR